MALQPTRSNGTATAAEVPLETARRCVEVAELAAVVAEKGNTNAVTDAGVAALLAEASCRGAVYNVRVNVNALDDKSKGAELSRESAQLVKKAEELARKTASVVEKALAG